MQGVDEAVARARRADHRVDHLAEIGIGDADDRRVGDAGVGQQRGSISAGYTLTPPEMIRSVRRSAR